MSFTNGLADSVMADHTAVWGNPDLFAKDMINAIHDQSDLSDIQFVLGEDREKINAHKIILATRCEVFRAMFAEQRHSKAKTNKDGTATVLVLPDVRPTVFLTVLHFIYTNSCQLSQETVVDVLASAIEYGLEGLIGCCVDYVTERLTVDTACEAIQAAITYSQDELRDACMEFIEQETEAVFGSPHFAELSDDTLSYILQSDNLHADEVQIFNAVQQWATVNMVVSEKPLHEVLRNVIEFVRFPLMSKEMLTKVENENKNGDIPVHLISKAWRFHATGDRDPADPATRPRKGKPAA